LRAQQSSIVRSSTNREGRLRGFALYNDGLEPLALACPWRPIPVQLHIFLAERAPTSRETRSHAPGRRELRAFPRFLDA
jgi:hypothetical protein